MFGSEIIDTAIGLIFTFLLVSVLVTVVNELLAALLLSRAKWLQFGIARLIGPVWATRLYAHPLIEATAPSAEPVTVLSVLRWRGSGPSYVPSRSFSNVLIHLVVEHDAWLPPFAAAVRATLANAAPNDDDGIERLVARIESATAALPDAASYRVVVDDLVVALRTRAQVDGLAMRQAYVAIDTFLDAMPTAYLVDVIDRLPPHDKLRKTLALLIREARFDVDKFRESIEVWFNNAMDRVSGWYKRRSQWVALALGLVAAVGLNVDPLAIGAYLQTHAGVRDAVVAKAKTYGSVPPPATPIDGTDAGARQYANAVQAFEHARRELTALSLPIGWNGDDPATASGWERIVAAHWMGWLLTALAATLGAPFWFDLLNRIVSIRSAGKAPEETPRPPKQQPTPLGPGEDPDDAGVIAAARRSR